MSENGQLSVEERLRAVEDRLAIYQLICGYGYAMDGRNADAVGSLYAEDAVYAVADMPAFEGRERIAAITQDEVHVGLVEAGCAHVSTLPYVVIDGDRAVATCHTMVVRKGETGFSVWRLSASRIQLSRKAEGGWQIDHRQNYLLDGDPAGPALLARLQEGPQQF
ncbi:nuclear transport factor 2 family protein [Trujillonella endophytica]|uniref:Ketosteroid isomerase homolog n=1 Tax=Trujillonella endophytica TaxID=673521 RepID=A0A1H8Q5A8_9ACTN|nr:nuclear transport factor 2 family protein [Trujillella endophytica]SEO48943.1 Ketosteroid isomerase homolog [Trujillella endophytica]